MVPFIITFFIIGFIITMLLVPIRANFIANNKIVFSVKYLFLVIYKSDRKKSVGSKQDEKKSDATTRHDEEKIKAYLKDLIIKEGIAGALFYLINVYIRPAILKLKKLGKHIVINELSTNVVVSSDDAAKTAIEYGGACSAVYPLAAFIESQFKVKNRDVQVNSKFDGSSSSIVFKINFSIKPLFLLTTVIEYVFGLIINLINNKKKRTDENE